MFGEYFYAPFFHFGGKIFTTGCKISTFTHFAYENAHSACIASTLANFVGCLWKI